MRSSLLYDPRRVANDRGTRRHVTRYHTARTNNRIVADGSAGENDSATADPDIPANPDGSSEFKTLTPLRRIARMIGRVDLTAGPICVPSPIVTSTTSRITQLKLRKTSDPRRMLKP